MEKFFIFCSGADTDLLKECSKGEKTKYFGIGATVFFTAVMAAIAGSFALFTVFDSSYVAVAFGLVWGLLIFNLDRYIVSTLRKKEHFWAEFWQASPRIFLAIIIAVVISKPLEIKIFEKEIQTVLLQEKNKLALSEKNQVKNYFKTDEQILSAEIDSLKNALKTKETEVNDLYKTYITEAEGTAGTKKLGKGPVYNEKRTKHDAALTELEELKLKTKEKITKLEKKKDDLTEKQSKQIEDTKPIIEGYDGLMARINALNKLPLLPSLFLMLLFLAIETAPIFTKLFSQKGEYDYKTDDAEHRFKLTLQQQKNQRELLQNTDAELTKNAYQTLENNPELLNDKKQKAIELLRWKTETFTEKEKKSL